MSELKARLLGQTMNEYGCDAKIYLKSDADNAIAELKAENERMKKKMDDYHLMSDIRRVKIKELQRALWLARADRAVAAQSVHEWCRYNEKHPCGLWKADPFEYWVQAWIYVEKLCRKKAAKFK